MYALVIVCFECDVFLTLITLIMYHFGYIIGCLFKLPRDLLAIARDYQQLKIKNSTFFYFSRRFPY